MNLNREHDFVEAAVVCLMFRPDMPAEVFEQISPEDFSTDMKPVMETAYRLFSNGDPVDIITVAETMEREGYVGSLDMLSRAVEVLGHVKIASLSYYAEQVKNRTLTRRLELALNQARELVNGENPRAAQEQILELIGKLGAQESKDLWDMRASSKLYLEELERRFEAGGELIGLSTGFEHLDDRISGMRPGDLIIVAGRPSMGKTTLALNILEHNAIHAKVPALAFSMEMPHSQLTEKLYASQGRIDLTRLRNGTLQEDDWPKLSAAAQLISRAPLFIDDRAALSIPQMRARAFEVRRKHGLGIIMVDYIQLMRGTGNSRVEEISEISRGLKQLAKDLEVPVIALSQLSRAVEQRTDKRPMMSDLRESGAIEQDADIIIFPYRPSYYDPDNRGKDPLTEVIFAKMRMGAVGSESLHFHGQYSQFQAMPERHDFEADRIAEQAERAEIR